MRSNTLKLLLLVLGLTAFRFPALSQSKPEQSVQLLTSELVGAVTIDIDAFGQWLRKANEITVEKTSGITEPMDVVVLVSLNHHRDADLQVASRPAMPEASKQGLLKALKESSPPHTLHASYSLAAITKLNGGGPDPEAKFEPALTDPLTLRINAFEALDLADQNKMLQKWAQEEIIPIFAHYASEVDEQFAGVRAVGKIMKEQQFLKTDVEQLTDRNPDYWRAVMEMSPGNQLIPYAKAAMHIARGEYDIADKIMFLASFFSEENSLPAELHDEMNDMIKSLQNKLNQQIQQGIALHDQGKYKAAVKHYDGLIKVCPNSAWLQYERYFSSVAGSNDDEATKTAWQNAKPIIYRCDPLYPMDVRASSGREGYLLFRRQEIPTLFKAREDFEKDFVTYADIALDLGAYGFAAQMYWMCGLYFESEDFDNRDFMAYFFYALDKMGNQENLTLMKDADAIRKKFPEIDQARLETMRKSPIYKSFEKGE